MNNEYFLGTRSLFLGYIVHLHILKQHGIMWVENRKMWYIYVFYFFYC